MLRVFARPPVSDRVQVPGEPGPATATAVARSSRHVPGGAVWEGDSVKPVNPLWYLAAFVFALGSTMVGTAVAASSWDPLREVTVSPTTTRADAQAKTLGVFTDILQPERHITCRAIGPDKKPVAIPKAKIDITVDELKGERDAVKELGLI